MGDEEDADVRPGKTGECEVNEGEDRVRKLVERRGMMRGLGCIGDAHVGGCRRSG
jgi:hypothetical protein